MCCFLAMIALFLPRLAIFLSFLVSNYIPRAFDSWVIPLLGFFFMPYSTLAYAIAMNEGHGLHGLWMVIFILGVLADFGVIGGSARARRRREVLDD